MAFSDSRRSRQAMREFDVLVVGGGNAGCAAAIASARHGARTMLVERYGFLGGTATAAMVGPWMTFHSGTDRIVGGIAQEIVDRLVSAGASPGHVHDSSDYVPTITPFDPEAHKALLFEMMREAGVHLLLHGYFLETILADRFGSGTREVAGARFATSGGVREYRARVTIDATADALVATSAGVPTQQGDERGRVQPASLMFRLSHVDLDELAAYVRLNPDQMRTSLKTHERTAQGLTAVAGLYDIWEKAREDGLVDVPRELVSFFISPYPDEVTRAEVEARLQAMQLLRFFKERVPGFANARIAATGTQIGIRESRRIAGRYTLTGDDVVQARHFDDAVARSAYPIDIHNPSGSGTTTQRVRSGESYEIPYRCMVPQGCDRLLVAGRCISTTHEALASTRLTPTVMTLGQAAGTAAALAVSGGVAVGDLDPVTLRAALIADGVDLRRPA